MLTDKQRSKLLQENQQQSVNRIEDLLDVLKTITYECDEMIDNYVEESAVVDVRNIAREAINKF